MNVQELLLCECEMVKCLLESVVYARPGSYLRKYSNFIPIIVLSFSCIATVYFLT